MITNLTMSPEVDRSYSSLGHSSDSTAPVLRAGADTRFLYGLLWALIAATLLAGSIAATLATTLVAVPV